MSRPKTGGDASMTLRFPSKLRDKLRAVATKERRSLTAQIISILERWVAEHPES